MFPPGGNNPGVSRFMTNFSQTRGGQGQPAPMSQGMSQPVSPAGGAPGTQMSGPAQSAGDHFAEAYQHIVAALGIVSQNPRDPANQEAVQAFMEAVAQLQPQAAPAQGPAGFPGISEGAAQSAPLPRGA